MVPFGQVYKTEAKYLLNLPKKSFWCFAENFVLLSGKQFNAISLIAENCDSY